MATLKPHQLRYVEGDTLPGLSGRITNDDGSPQDISGYKITLHIDYPDPVIVPAAIVDAADGRYVIAWRDDDLREGDWAFEIQVVDAGGGIVTINRHASNGAPLELIVDRQVA